MFTPQEVTVYAEAEQWKATAHFRRRKQNAASLRVSTSVPELASSFRTTTAEQCVRRIAEQEQKYVAALWGALHEELTSHLSSSGTTKVHAESRTRCRVKRSWGGIEDQCVRVDAGCEKDLAQARVYTVKACNVAVAHSCFVALWGQKEAAIEYLYCKILEEIRSRGSAN